MKILASVIMMKWKKFEVIKKNKLQREFEIQEYDSKLFQERASEIKKLLDADPNKKRLISLDKSF